MRKKFKIYTEAGEYKCKKGEMVCMTSGGVFMLLSGLDDYYMSKQKLSDVIGTYAVVWKGGENES